MHIVILGTNNRKQKKDKPMQTKKIKPEFVVGSLAFQKMTKKHPLSEKKGKNQLRFITPRKSVVTLL